MERIDTFLVTRNLAESREQAKRLILAGAVAVNGNRRIKPGHRIAPDAAVTVKGREPYVSRGGLKLEKALRVFDVTVQNRIALDVGASTGGFTDCLLQHGATFVYAVDVGYGQLAWKLRQHPQVAPIEKTNIRYLTPDRLKTASAETETLKNGTQNIEGTPETEETQRTQETEDNRDRAPSLATVDVSFISLRTVLPNVLKLLKEQAGSIDIIALLKPQFEAGRAHVKKGGIVSDTQVHIRTIESLRTFVTEKLGTNVRGITYSPIHKDIGNIEYLLWITSTSGTDRAATPVNAQTTAALVASAQKHFEN